MVDGLDGDSQLEQALAGGAPQRAGWFRLYFNREQWEWSPEVERMHGYEPGTVQPTIKLVLSHKHPDDYEQVVAAVGQISSASMAASAAAISSCPVHVAESRAVAPQQTETSGRMRDTVQRGVCVIVDACRCRNHV